MLIATYFVIVVLLQVSSFSAESSEVSPPLGTDRSSVVNDEFYQYMEERSKSQVNAELYSCDFYLIKFLICKQCKELCVWFIIYKVYGVISENNIYFFLSFSILVLVKIFASYFHSSSLRVTYIQNSGFYSILS